MGVIENIAVLAPVGGNGIVNTLFDFGHIRFLLRIEQPEQLIEEGPEHAAAQFAGGFERFNLVGKRSVAVFVGVVEKQLRRFKCGVVCCGGFNFLSCSFVPIVRKYKINKFILYFSRLALSLIRN
jgi:hypothetical protein